MFKKNKYFSTKGTKYVFSYLSHCSKDFTMALTTYKNLKNNYLSVGNTDL